MESGPVANPLAEIERLRRRLEGAGINPDSPVPTRMRAVERRHEVLQAWRMTGASHRALGQRFGVTHRQIQKDLAQALDEEIINQNLTTEREKVWIRANLMFAQGEMMMILNDRRQPVVVRIGAARTLKLLYDRFARLDGLDAPIRIDRLGEAAAFAASTGMSEDEAAALLEQLVAEQRQSANRRRLRAV